MHDALNRVISVVDPDNTAAQIVFLGAAASIQDEGNNSGSTKHIAKVYQLDALGRLKSVCEVSGSTQLGSSNTPVACSQDVAAQGFLSSYLYDAAGHITSVNQPGLGARTYASDGVGRMTQEIGPESGTTTYSYDTDTQATSISAFARSRIRMGQERSRRPITSTKFIGRRESVTATALRAHRFIMIRVPCQDLARPIRKAASPMPPLLVVPREQSSATT